MVNTIDNTVAGEIDKHTSERIIELERAFNDYRDYLKVMTSYQQILSRTDFWDRCTAQELHDYHPLNVERRLEKAKSPLGLSFIVRDAIKFYQDHIKSSYR